MASTPANYTTIADGAAALESFQRKLQVVCDHVTGVYRGHKHGLLVWGGGGVRKSFTVLECLDNLEAPYKLFNGRMSAPGLFLALKNAPDTIHVLDDMQRITRDHDAQGVLLGALWAPPGHDRTPTWTTARSAERFVFRGGIIMTSNQPLAALPELRALATRIEVYHLDPTDAELTAKMRALATNGFHIGEQEALAPDVCLEVTEYLLAECRAASCPLDLRLQQKSYRTYLQWEQGDAVTHWRDLITASVRETAHHFRHAESSLGEDQRRQRRNILRAIMQQTNDASEQLRLYREQTGASRADFFRKKEQILSGELDAEDAT